MRVSKPSFFLFSSFGFLVSSFVLLRVRARALRSKGELKNAFFARYSLARRVKKERLLRSLFARSKEKKREERRRSFFFPPPLLLARSLREKNFFLPIPDGITAASAPPASIRSASPLLMWSAACRMQ